MGQLLRLARVARTVIHPVRGAALDVGREAFQLVTGIIGRRVGAVTGRAGSRSSSTEASPEPTTSPPQSATSFAQQQRSRSRPTPATAPSGPAPSAPAPSVPAPAAAPPRRPEPRTEPTTEDPLARIDEALEPEGVLRLAHVDPDAREEVLDLEAELDEVHRRQDG